MAGGDRPFKGGGTATDVGTDPSCHVLSVEWRFSAEPPENGAKSKAFREKTGNIRLLAAICSDMIFVRRRFCGNEAILGGQYTAIEDCCAHSLEVCGSRVYTPLRPTSVHPLAA